MTNAFYLVLFLGLLFTQPGSCGIIDILNQLVSTNLPKINAILHENIPQSVGNCNDNNPPKPCLCTAGCADLYNVHKSWEYKAYARWISGLQTGNLSKVVFAETSNGAVITVDVEGFFGALPLSLYIGECLTFDQCVKLWDNTEGCCGTNKKFTIGVAVDCKNAFPYLNTIKLTSLTLDKFEITEKIVGIKIDLEDITNTIEAHISSLLKDYMTNEVFIPYNGTKVNLLTFVNNEIRDETHGTFTCPTSVDLNKVFFK